MLFLNVGEVLLHFIFFKYDVKNYLQNARSSFDIDQDRGINYAHPVAFTLIRLGVLLFTAA